MARLCGFLVLPRNGDKKNWRANAAGLVARRAGRVHSAICYQNRELNLKTNAALIIFVGATATLLPPRPQRENRDSWTEHGAVETRELFFLQYSTAGQGEGEKGRSGPRVQVALILTNAVTATRAREAFAGVSFGGRRREMERDATRGHRRCEIFPHRPKHWPSLSALHAFQSCHTCQTVHISNDAFGFHGLTYIKCLTTLEWDHLKA